MVSTPTRIYTGVDNVHDAPVVRQLLEGAWRLDGLRPRVIRPDAGYWGLKLIVWIHTALGVVAVIPHLELVSHSRMIRPVPLSPSCPIEEEDSSRRTCILYPCSSSRSDFAP